VFGIDDWKEYFGLDFSGAPGANLDNMESLMNADGNIFLGAENAKVFHTHVLTYIPENFGAGKDITINNLIAVLKAISPDKVANTTIN